MSQYPERQVLPFLTRDMLAFEHAATFTLRITSVSDVSQVCTISGMTREGPFILRHDTVYDGTAHQDTYRLPDMPITVSVACPDPTALQGQIYVILDLLVNNTLVETLISGLVHEVKGLGWPINVSQDPIPGHGEFCVIAGANPAAGADCTFTVEALQMWRILGFSASLVTSATVANRRVHLKFSHADGAVLESLSSVDHAASLTRLYSGNIVGGNLAQADDNDILIPIPQDIWLRESSTITTSTTNLQVGDDWGVPSLLIERFWRSNA